MTTDELNEAHNFLCALEEQLVTTPGNDDLIPKVQTAIKAVLEVLANR